MTTRTCGNCVFFSAGPKLCRVSAPVAAASGKAVWPVVDAGDWCGSWSDIITNLFPPTPTQAEWTVEGVSTASNDVTVSPP